MFAGGVLKPDMVIVGHFLGTEVLVGEFGRYELAGAVRRGNTLHPLHRRQEDPLRVIVRLDLGMGQQRRAANVARLGKGDDRTVALGGIRRLEDGRAELADGLVAGLVFQDHFAFDGDIAPSLVAVVDLGGDGEPLFIGGVGAGHRHDGE